MSQEVELIMVSVEIGYRGNGKFPLSIFTRLAFFLFLEILH
jgi:hypothetical protein